MSVRNTVKAIQDIMRQDAGVDGDAQRISQLCWMFFLKILDDQDQELELLDSTYRSPIPEALRWRTWGANPEGITGDELLRFINNDLFPTLKELIQLSLHAVEKKPLPHMLCTTNMLLHGIEDPSFVRHDNTLARPYISYTQQDRVDIVLTNPPFGGKEEPGIESNFPKQFQTRETADLFLALIMRLLKPGGRAAVLLPDGSLFGEGVKTRLKEHLMEECNLHTIVRLPNSVFKPYASIGTNLLFFEKGIPTKDIWFWEHRVPEGQKAYSMTKPIRLEHFQGCIDWWGGKTRKGREEGPRAWKVTAQ